MSEAQLILDRCDELAAISSEPEFLKRVHLSPEHAAANALVAQWMTEAA
jgi:allantoate deiminase